MSDLVVSIIIIIGQVAAAGGEVRGVGHDVISEEWSAGGGLNVCMNE